MKEILFKYMTKFTSLNEEEQAIVKGVLIKEYKKGPFSLDRERFPLNVIASIGKRSRNEI